MLSEVAGLGRGEIPCRLRKHDLAAVRRCADAGRPVHVEADITIADDRRLSGVNPHPDVNRQPFQSTLSGGSSEDGVVRSVERIEEGVALRVDLVARSERLAQPLTVLLEQLRIRALAELGE
jgi:hypothetical protein